MIGRDKITEKHFPILLVEDDEHDILAMKRIWEKHHIPHPLYIVQDGKACLHFLQHRGRYENPISYPRPGVVFLDLKMPKMGGLTVLRHIRNDKALHLLPVIIWTQSLDEEEKMRSYELRANAVIAKPIGLHRLSKVIQIVVQFWGLAELPG